MTITESRIETLRASFPPSSIDALIVLVAENRYYLSGFKAEDHQYDELSGVLLIAADRLVLVTDSRFELQANEEAPDYDVVIYRKGLSVELPDILKQLEIQRLGFEARRMSVDLYRQMKTELEKAQVEIELIPVNDLVENQRLIKSTEEIQKTQKALDLAERVFLETVKFIKPGMTEASVAWLLEKGMREAGAESLSFPPIVAAGPNSALPHAVPTERPIQEGEPILFDWGASLNGYCSDTSRTVILGHPDDTFCHVFETVRVAQKKAIQAIRSGVDSKAVDSIARQWIDQQGYKGKFGHGLGHGTGLAVHEGPRLSPLKNTVLQSGMLVTVEPGIYLPGWGGVRMENQVVVNGHGANVLNNLNDAFEISQISIS